MQMWYLQKLHQFFTLIVHMPNSAVNFDAYIVTMFAQKGITNKVYSFDLHWSCKRGIIIVDPWPLGVHDVHQ